MIQHEGYPADWVKVTLMVSPRGEVHAIDGDRTDGDPRDDLPFVGLERIKSKWVGPIPSITEESGPRLEDLYS